MKYAEREAEQKQEHSTACRRPPTPLKPPSPVSFQHTSSNSKLSPVRHIEKKIVVPETGRVSSLYWSIAATCPSTCPFLNDGCYVQVGRRTRKLTRELDEAATGMSPEEVLQCVVDALDGVFRRGVPQDGVKGGRDLRLAECGDFVGEAGARMLAGAAQRWLERGGGTPWGYTHCWRGIPREAFDPIHIAASVETIDDADEAYERGYLPAMVVPEFKEAKPYPLEGSRNGLKLIPCPAEIKGTTCVECRLCLERTPKRAVIGFQAHGNQKNKVIETLLSVDTLVRRPHAAPAEEPRTVATKNTNAKEKTTMKRDENKTGAKADQVDKVENTKNPIKKRRAAFTFINAAKAIKNRNSPDADAQVQELAYDTRRAEPNGGKGGSDA